MKNFTRFASLFHSYSQAMEVGLARDKGASGPLFEQGIKTSLKKCHLFEVTTDIKRLLALTNCPNKNEDFNLPFPIIFIDVGFKHDEMKKLGIDIGYTEIIGIIASKAYLYTEEANRQLQELAERHEDFDGIELQHELEKIHKPLGTGLRITICYLDKKADYSVGFDTYNANINIADEYEDLKLKIKKIDDTHPMARKFCHLFVLNFLNFLYDTRVKIVKVHRDEKRNFKRIKQGKQPIPDRSLIKLTGDLKIYTDNLKKDKRTWEYSYSWWVRGHYRVLRDPDYWGKKAGTRIFIPPYIKGKGVLVSKKYTIDKHAIELEGTKT